MVFSQTYLQKNADNLSPDEIMRWHIAAGVDETIGEESQNRFDAIQSAQALAPAPAQTPAPAAVQTITQNPKPIPDLTPGLPQMPPAAKANIKTPGHDQALKSAVKIAGDVKTIDELRAALEQFDGCALKKTATNMVFGDGNQSAKVVLIGDAPGADEDRQGIPFAGPSGTLLDKMLASINLSRSDVYISNTVFWRPPGNRTPNAGEIAVCQPFVERMVELIDPEILITVGGPATHSLLAQQGSVSKLRGKWFTFETPRMSRPIMATAIYHPDYLLSSPAMKRPTWHDLIEIRKKIDGLG
ncbi:MAG: uracil-DNA glycosylase [Rhodospirillaceae bacterium]|nr:uracil-DNA glycosylase [Rhodospirillaceae bacterium]